MTESPPHILAALKGVMSDVTAMGKDGFNQQQKFPFRSHDGVINLLGPAYRKHDVIPTVIVTGEERREYKTKTGTTMMETRVEITYVLKSLVDGSTHVVAEGIRGEASDAGDKSSNKAQTVAVRIALLHGFAIPTQEPDPDEQTYERAEVVSLTTEQAELMSTVTAELSDDSIKQLNSWYKAQNLPKKEFLTEQQADMVLMKMSALLSADNNPEPVQAAVPMIDPETGEILNEYDNPSDPF